MKRKTGRGLVLFLVFPLLLTGCGNGSKNLTDAKPSPVASSTEKPKFTPYTKLPSGLAIPYMDNVLPIISSGQAVDKFGKKYVNDAYRFGFAFTYKAYSLPEIWQPNTKKNPAYKTFLKQDISLLGRYFTEELNHEYLNEIPGLVISSESKGKCKFNDIASKWATLILLPCRDISGSLILPTQKEIENGIMLNFVPMSPYVVGISSGTPVATIDTVEPWGDVLKIDFRYTVNVPYGDGISNIYIILKTTKTVSYWIVPNRDSTSKIKYLIAKWGVDPDSNINVSAYDPKTSGYTLSPTLPEFP